MSISLRSKSRYSGLLLPALSALQNCPCVLRAGLVSDHLRAITPKDVSLETLQGNLEQEGIGSVKIEAAGTHARGYLFSSGCAGLI